MEKLKQLWKEHKKEGLMIYSSRNSGKTNAVIDIALEEAKTKKVSIWIMSETAKIGIKDIIRDKLDGRIPKNIRVFNINSRGDHKLAYKFNPIYIFYDEVRRTKAEPNSLAIRTLQAYENIFIFNVKNTKPFIEKKDLKMMRTQIGEKRWRAEYMSGVIDDK